jgi:hypothetical protein
MDRVGSILESKRRRQIWINVTRNLEFCRKAKFDTMQVVCGI